MTRRKDEQLSAQAQELRRQGLSIEQIGVQMEISTRQVYNHLGGPEKQGVSKVALNTEAVLAFLDSHTRVVSVLLGFGHPERRIAGVSVGKRGTGEAMARSIDRWKEGVDHPTLWGLDRHLTKYLHGALHIEDYFDYCEREGLNPWAGEKPVWHP